MEDRKKDIDCFILDLIEDLEARGCTDAARIMKCYHEMFFMTWEDVESIEEFMKEKEAEA